MSDLIALSDEQRMLVDAVGKVAASYGHRYFSDKARSGDDITEMWNELGNAGYLGVSIPESYGGGGGGLTDLALVIEESTAQGIPLFMAVVSQGVCGSILLQHASEEMKSEWLPAMASGEKVMAFAMTEPDAGTNSHNIATSARRDGDDWIINGSKVFISGADNADAILVVARTGFDSDTGKAKLSMFVVPADAPGLQMDRIELELVSPDRQYMLFFDDVRIPAEALIGEENRGLRQVFAGLTPERVAVAAQACGIGRYAVDRATDYARTRQVWSTPIGAHQGISHPLAKCHIDVQLARLATFRAAAMFDEGVDASEIASIAKYSAGEAAGAALDQAIQTHGGNGLSREYGLADLWFVMRMMRVAPLSQEMILNQVAMKSLGLPRSY